MIIFALGYMLEVKLNGRIWMSLKNMLSERSWVKGYILDGSIYMKFWNVQKMIEMGTVAMV